MENKDGHEGTELNHEQSDSNQSNQHRRTDEQTSSAVDDDNNNSSGGSSVNDRELSPEMIALIGHTITLIRRLPRRRGEQPDSNQSNQRPRTDEQTSAGLNRRRRREQPDSNQSNQRRRTDEQTSSAVDDDNNSSSGSSLEEWFRPLGAQNQREQPDSNQSNRTDEQTSAADNNNNSAGPSVNNDRQMGEDAQHASEGENSRNEGGTRDTTGTIFMMIILDARIINTEGMSYEEIRELQERMGIVERGLSKETISSHLKTRVHTTTSVDSAEMKTDICTICQDEYENENKIGILDCNHEYHEDCITQWLVLKNVCPICKREALNITEENKNDAAEC